MNDASEFNLDRINEAVKRINSLTRTIHSIDNLRADAVERKLQNVTFVCEAFSEMDDTDIQQIGRLAARTRHDISVDALKLAIGELVCRGLVGYAEKCVAIDNQWQDFDRRQA